MTPHDQYLAKNCTELSRAYMIPLDWLIPAGPDNIRLQMPESIEASERVPISMSTPEDAELVLSISQVGILYPIVARWNGIDPHDGLPSLPIEDGDRRVEGYRFAVSEGYIKDGFSVGGVTYVDGDTLYVPALVLSEDEDYDPLAMRERQFAYNMSLPLSPFQRAMNYAERNRDGKSMKEIADAVNKSEGHVSQAIRVTQACDSIVLDVVHGKLGMTVAYLVCAYADKTQQDEADLYPLLVAALGENFSRSTFSKWVAKQEDRTHIPGIDPDQNGDKEPSDNGGNTNPTDSYTDPGEDDYTGEDKDSVKDPVDDVYAVEETITVLIDHCRNELLTDSYADVVEAICSGLKEGKSPKYIIEQVRKLELMNAVTDPITA